MVLQVCSNNYYVLSRIRYVGFLTASKGNVITNNENFPCYLFIYFMVYVLPMVLILASRFFFLCWRYRIPFFYFASINAAHIVEWSWYTTNDMIDSCFTIMVVTAMFYIYGFFDIFISRSKLGRKICA